jgi:hypothetical protein
MTWLEQRREDGKMANWVEQMRNRSWTLYGRNWLETAGGDEEFAVWLVHAHLKVSRFAGVGLFDLEDFNSRDLFDAGVSPGEGAREALENDETFGPMMEELRQ